jgi:Lon protease-like protein
LIVPLFPLQSVLFPHGRLPLRIFEQRYMDMAKVCLKESSPFGVCLIAQGDEVAQPGKPAAEPHSVGTLATIADWDMPQLGVLNISAEGGCRFRITRHWTEASGLLRAEVSEVANPPVIPIPGDYARLVPLLRIVIAELAAGGGNSPVQPHRFFDAGWVGMRYAEVLPIPPSAKQRLLEVEDSLDRLEIIYRLLESKGMLPAA